MIDSKGKIISTKGEKGMKELKISKEAVLEAAEKCSNAKEVLKVLFPSVFKVNFLHRGTLKQASNIINQAFSFSYEGDIPPDETQERADYLLARFLYEAHPGDGRDPAFDSFSERILAKYPKNMGGKK